MLYEKLWLLRNSPTVDSSCCITVIRCEITIRESPLQFENRIMARVYVRSITRSTLYQKAGTGVWKLVARGVSCIKIDYSDYSKS